MHSKQYLAHIIRGNWSHTRLLAWLFLSVMLIITLAPLVVMLRTAFEHPSQLYSNTSMWWPQEATLVNFRRVIGQLNPEQSLALGGSGAEINFIHALGQSLMFSALVVLLQTLSCAMAAYAFARLRFPGKRIIFGAFIGSMMLPGVVLFIPNFILIRDLGWLNSMAGMVAPFALISGFSIFFLRQFFLSIPRDLEEAALLDGASRWMIFWRVVVPLSTTPLATIAMLTGINAWNEFFWPFVVSPGEDHQVLPVALQAFKAQTPQGQIDWTGLMAASTLAMLPILLLMVLAGRKVIESVQYSGGK
jgi:multiple sugar transport system permease protein